MTTRVRAPRLTGRSWLNTGGVEPDLRGRFVLLDFWTFCCVNCLHVLEELRPLEAEFADVLTVVGVHSPKFVHEADPDALVAAVERYAVHHPVLDDPELSTWKQFAVRAWPTLVLVDPAGYVVHVASGEGHVEGIGRLLRTLLPEYDGQLRRGDGPYTPPAPTAGELAFPGKALRLPDGGLLVSDSSHDSVVELASGRRYDGFLQPQGICLLGDQVVVADTGHHRVVALDLASGQLTPLAGTGEVWRPGDATSGPALSVHLSTPWDVAVWQGEVVIAMAGTHQLHALSDGQVRVLAGTTAEGLRDGSALDAYLAQPSGLATGPDRLWFVDAETSALRWYRSGQVGTAVGTGLFDFGHRDGAAGQALFQHPLGLSVLPDGSVAVCDTYNGAVRRYDPATDTVTTLMTGLAEPSDAVVDGDALLVVESAAHRVSRVLLPAEALVVDGVAQRTQRPATDLAPGPVLLTVVFTPPPGQKLDDSFGPSTRLNVSGPLVADGAGSGTDLARSLVLQGDSGVLHVAASAASCDVEVEHPACHVTQQDWGIPVRLVEGAPSELTLVLNGL